MKPSHWITVALAAIWGAGCREPDTESAILVEQQHQHYHVHAADVEHEHTHSDGEPGGHTHDHRHGEADYGSQDGDR